MLQLNGPSLEQGILSQDKALIIVFHGWGSDGANLVSMGQFWQQELANAKFYFPNAPLPCENGSGYAWFPLNKDLKEKRHNLVNMAPFIEDWIRDLQQKEGVTSAQTFLVGFSQGAMLSLYLGLTCPDLIKGVVAYSGGLIGHEEWENPDKHVSYMILHGEEDKIVPVSEFYLAQKVLDEHQLIHQDVLIPGLAHSIDQQGILMGLAFLKNLITPKDLN